MLRACVRLLAIGALLGADAEHPFGRRQGAHEPLKDAGAGSGAAWNAATALEVHRQHKSAVMQSPVRAVGHGGALAALVRKSPNFGAVLRQLDQGHWHSQTEAEQQQFWTRHELRQVRRREKETYDAAWKRRYGGRMKPLYSMWECSVLKAQYHPCFFQNFSDFNKRWSGVVSGSVADVLTTWRAAGGRKGTVAFVGDSITQQNMWAAMCDLLRRGFKVVRKDESVPRGKGWSSDFETEFRFTVRAPPPADPEELQDFRFLKLNRYNPIDVPEYLNDDNAIIFLNWGMWYPKKEYGQLLEDHMRAFLPQFAAWAGKGGMAVFREVTPQHFKSEDGGYHGKYVPGDPAHACAPISHEKACLGGKSQCAGWNTAWQYPVVQRVMAELGINNGSQRCEEAGSPRGTVYTLPIFDVYADRFDNHPGYIKGIKTDCTHWCHTPMFWEPMWDRLAAALMFETQRCRARA